MCDLLALAASGPRAYPNAMIIRRPLIALLALLVLVTSIGLGAARGAAAPADAVVICRGHASVTVFLDADGNEVGHHSICPEAALALMVQGGVFAPEIAAPLTLFVFGIVAPTASVRASAGRIAPVARGPPVLL